MKNNIKVSAVCPRVVLADTAKNAANIIKAVKTAAKQGAQFIITPELSLTGATCGDLFLQPVLLECALNALNKILQATKKIDAVIIVGLPLKVSTQIINASAVLHKGKILGLVPAENCETRYFTPARQIRLFKTLILGQKVPLNTFIFKVFNTTFAVKTGLDLNNFPPLMPKVKIVLNPSSNYEYLGKQDKLESLISIFSTVQNCVYVYASSAFGESSAETVYSANALIYNNGILIAKCPRLTMQGQIATCAINEKTKINSE